jgi:hypothetical protein
MLKYRFIHQPDGGNHAAALQEMVLTTGIANVDMAIAYASDSGVTVLLDSIDRHEPARAHWSAASKRFLVGIDWFRSQPTALDRLAAIPRSNVRIHDGRKVVAKAGCIPRTPWHPKVTSAYGADLRSAVYGSANLSRNGLLTGAEVGSIAEVVNPSGTEEQLMWDELDRNVAWFQAVWRSATPWRSIRSEYYDRYKVEAIPRAVPTEDDADPSEVLTTNRRGVTPERLHALRVANHLWIETGNLHKNRGANRPGDQLMMSPMTRVFFGRSARRVDVNHALGNVPVRHAATGTVEMRPLRFSDNSMDVLTLPVPGAPPWPTSYDQTCLLFSKVSVGRDLHYEMRVVSGRDKRRYRTLSQAQTSAYRMTSGREWGVFG